MYLVTLQHCLKPTFSVALNIVRMKTSKSEVWIRETSDQQAHQRGRHCLFKSCECRERWREVDGWIKTEGQNDEQNWERRSETEVWLPLAHIGQICVYVRNPAGHLRESHWKVCEEGGGGGGERKSEYLRAVVFISQLERNKYLDLILSDVWLPYIYSMIHHRSLAAASQHLQLLTHVSSNWFHFIWIS